MFMIQKISQKKNLENCHFEEILVKKNKLPYSFYLGRNDEVGSKPTNQPTT